MSSFKVFAGTAGFTVIATGAVAMSTMPLKSAAGL